jgi:predicted Zn-dependent protease
VKQATLAILDREYFEKLTHFAFSLLQPKEALSISMASESSHFIRINAAKVRQIGQIQESVFDLTLIFESAPGRLHKCSHSFTLTGLSYEDQSLIKFAVKNLQAEARELPQDPFAELPHSSESSAVEKKGQLLDRTSAVSEILEPIGSTDLAGIYASGPIVRAMANSVGQKHWFSTENFSLDYSLYTPGQRAMKGTFAGSHWQSSEYAKELQHSKSQLAALEKRAIQIPKGSHRTYLAPVAAFDLVAMFNWGGLSEAAIQQGDSPLRKLRSREKTLSPLFSLKEDFSKGTTPRFNSQGELAAEHLTLIEKGQLRNSLVSARTAKEYGASSNQACSSETFRSAVIAPGSLKEGEILKQLNTGLYLSNLHYLNWSDQPGGRITGMTRYACFWVEQGQIVAPIESMRFDDTVFNFFGAALIDLTSTQTFIPEVGSYEMRDLGGAWCPGMLLSGMSFTN